MSLNQLLQDRKVAVSSVKPQYCSKPPFDPSDHFPEYDGPVGEEDNPAYRGMREVFSVLEYDDHFGTSLLNPLGHLINPGETLAVKPNWVNHRNQCQRAYDLTDTDCLITHGSIFRAVLDYVCLALNGKGKIIFGDAPIQGADWNEIIKITGAFKIIDSLQHRFPKIKLELTDFRVECAIMKGNRIIGKTRRTIEAEDYIEADLKRESMLMPRISYKKYSFSVAKYPKYRMTYAHSIYRNVYLCPKDVLEADVSTNHPKFKTHLKAGKTCALKNLVRLEVLRRFIT